MLENMPVIIFDSCTGLPELLEAVASFACEFVPVFESSLASPMPIVIMLVMSKPWSWICSGYSESVFSSTFAIYWFTPFASDKMAAMPIMPMLPAKAVMSVRPFFVSKFLNESESAVKNDMLV